MSRYRCDNCKSISFISKLSQDCKECDTIIGEYCTKCYEASAKIIQTYKCEQDFCKQKCDCYMVVDENPNCVICSKVTCPDCSLYPRYLLDNICIKCVKDRLNHLN